MSRMRPNFIEDGSPPGEKVIFHRLQAVEGDWTVIHSLDVAPSNNNKRTEIDFLVIIPDLGLLCVEVKSHVRITFDGERWHPDSIKRSPFRQAEDAKHALIRRFKKIRKLPDGARLPFPIAKVCIFTHSSFDIRDCVGLNPTELIDAQQLDHLRTQEEFREKLRSCMLSGLRNDGILPLTVPLTGEQVDEIVQQCLPIQRRKAGTREELEAAEKNLLDMLREQQRPVLRLSELNPRLLVTGPAGTGKTLIAIELAKRLSEQGGRVGLLCFNQLLGRWLEDQLSEHPGVIAGPAIRTLAAMSGISVDSASAGDQQYWDQDLPESILDRMTSPDFKSDYAFDVLLIDEGQDLLPKEALWDCLMQSVFGGQDEGRYIIYGDFSHQVIAGGHGFGERLAAFKKAVRPAQWELRENCRNLSLIGRAAEDLLGAEGSVYEGYRRINWDVHLRKYILYSSAEEQKQKVLGEVAAFRAEGFQSDDIVLLSFCAADRSLGDSLEQSGEAFCRIGAERRGCIPYTTINSYKGMERKVVIITDVDDLREFEHERPRLFVGATRATERLRILLTQQAEDLL